MRSLAIGIITDEVSSNFREAVSLARMWGVSAFEIRSLQSGRIPVVDSMELAEVREIVLRDRLAVSALSPGIFKQSVLNEAAIEREINNVLPETIEVAKTLKTKLIIVFGFQREKAEPPENLDRAVQYIKRAANIAERNGLRIAVENEPGFWCDSGSATSDIIRRVGLKAAGANWDPANAIGTGERPYPEGYSAIRNFVMNVHVKDTTESALRGCVPVGEGVVDWPGQIKALANDGTVGLLTIETHCPPLAENSLKNVRTVQKYLKEIGLDN